MPVPEATDAVYMDRIFERSVATKSGCWEWSGARKPNGYGNIYFRGSVQPAHRVSFLLFRGPLPPGMYACHRCDNPGCVNPAHLFAGTPQENQRDMRAKRRQNNPVKISAADVVAIRERRHAGDSLRTIAATFGVSEASVSLIARGLSRASV